jgi:hypothetical protein
MGHASLHLALTRNASQSSQKESQEVVWLPRLLPLQVLDKLNGYLSLCCACTIMVQLRLDKFAKMDTGRQHKDGDKRRHKSPDLF